MYWRPFTPPLTAASLTSALNKIANQFGKPGLKNPHHFFDSFDIYVLTFSFNFVLKYIKNMSLSYERDEDVKAWCDELDIEWIEKVGHTLWDPFKVTLN